MSNEPENAAPTEEASPHPDADEPGGNHIALRAGDIDMLPTLTAKADALVALPPDVRHAVLGALPPTTVAAVIENDERANLLLANLPYTKFHEIVALGDFRHGRQWLERAATSGSLAGALLPSLMNPRDLAEMLLTEPEFRRVLPRLLNYERAERWRQLLTPAEWHTNLTSMLLSDAEELIAKTSFKNKDLKAVVQSLVDFVPELYLEAVMAATERLKYAQDRPDEFEDLTSLPFTIAEARDTEPPADGGAPDGSFADSPLGDVLPEGGDPVFALATAGLSAQRKAFLETQLRDLLRQEVLATASFAEAAMQRAAGRVLAYLRVGLEAFGPSLEEATLALDKHDLPEIGALGARAIEGYRQKALALAGLRDWLDSRQRQFLDAMKQPEAGMHPETREPVLWLASRPKQEREEWHPAPLAEIVPRLADIATWASLARAAFATPERVHVIYNTAKTRTAGEALRRTVVALALYRRWEPELVRPAEDFAAFERQYRRGRRGRLDAVRERVQEALDLTPDGAWKPSDAKSRARNLLMRVVDEIEAHPLTDDPPRR
jgi:hypothetical protein